MTSQPMSAVERVKAALQKANMLYGPGRPMADGYATKLAEYALAALAPASEEVEKNEVHDVLQGLAGLCLVHPHHTDLRNAMDLIQRLTAELATLRAQAGEKNGAWNDAIEAAIRAGNSVCDNDQVGLSSRQLKAISALRRGTKRLDGT